MFNINTIFLFWTIWSHIMWFDSVFSSQSIPDGQSWIGIKAMQEKHIIIRESLNNYWRKSSSLKAWCFMLVSEVTQRHLCSHVAFPRSLICAFIVLLAVMWTSMLFSIWLLKHASVSYISVSIRKAHFWNRVLTCKIASCTAFICGHQGGF